MPTIETPLRATNLTKRDLSWFAERTLRGRTEIFAEVATITPTIARHIMEQNLDNRGVLESAVAQIAADITNDRWELNGESIIIAKDGHLNDGQHRLLAIIQADRPVQAVMTFGVSRRSRFTVDQGRVRSVAQFLAMNKGISTTLTAAVSMWWLSYTKGIYGKPSKNNKALFTKQEQLAFYESRKAKIDDAVAKFKHPKGFTATSLITSYLILWEVDPIHADGFINMLLEGANLEIDDPVLWLRDKLRTEDWDTWVKTEMTLRYWNAWKENRRIKKSLPVMGAWPSYLASR